jgi:hypothetical protein
MVDLAAIHHDNAALQLRFASVHRSKLLCGNLGQPIFF